VARGHVARHAEFIGSRGKAAQFGNPDEYLNGAKAIHIIS